ncbi:MAG: outer membrane beta-barrel protein [Roseiarcus sp.]
MRSRLSELRRARCLALGVLALASIVAPAASFAQDAASDALGLRGDAEALATAAQTPTAANLGPSTPDPVNAVTSGDANPAAKDKKPHPKKAAKPARPVGVYPGAQRLGQRGGPPDLASGQTPSPTIAAIPPPPPRRRAAADDKPFDPLGISVGDLKLAPYVEEDLGVASNPALAAGPQKGSAFETTEAGLALQSDWSRSDLHGSLKGGYTDYFADPQANVPYGGGVLDGRLDVTRDLSFDAEGRFNVSEQTLASLGLVAGGTAGASEHPLVETFGATLGGAQKFGDLTLALHGTLDRTMYQDATLPGGGVADLSSDNFNDWGLRARASYRISPFISPFVEVDVDTRRYDAPVDYNGYARNSDGAQALGGATLAFTQQLTGEASVGYGARAYQDARLPDMRSPLIDASLIWSATPLTTLTAKAQTTLADVVTAGASGAVTRAYTIDVAHALTRAVTLGASAGYTSDDYVGVALHDATTSLGLRAEYHLSRDFVLKASATRQDYTSSAPNSNYIANVFMLGLRLQR